MDAGLASLPHLLPPDKAVVALRAVASGREPGPEDFDRRGLTLSQDEQKRLSGWLRRGLRSRVHDEVQSADGTLRLVLRLHDGAMVETVAMPVGAVCVSSQVGCAVGCRFCASGLLGLRRQLTTEEITEQVVHARRRMPLSRVVFMGMGEPSHNLDAVLEAVAWLQRQAGIGPRRVTVSTVGSPSAFSRMAAAEVRPCLALSLHSADDARRRQLLPRAPKVPVAELVAAAGDYGRCSGMPVQFEWTLLQGINDSLAEADALADLVRPVRGYVNFIVWNEVAGLPFSAPPRQRVVELVRRVKARGVLATIRDSSGPDAEAACGQLRLRSLAGSVSARS